MKIKSKLFVGFGVLLLIMFVLAGLGTNRIQMTDSGIKDVYENRYQKVKLTAQMRNDFAELAKAIVNLLLIDNPETDRISEQRIRALSDNIGKQIDQAEKLFSNSQEQALGAEVARSGRAFMDYKDQVVGLHQKGQIDQANALRTTTGIGRQDDFNQSMASMSKFQEENMDRAVATLQEENKRVFAYTGLITVGGLIVGFLIMYWIAVSLTKGLNTLLTMMQKFGEGEWEESANRIPVTSSDEFGSLAKIFNQMADDLADTAAKERKLQEMNEETIWLQSNIGTLYAELQEVTRLEELGERFIATLARLVGAHDAAFYVVRETAMDKKLTLAGAYSRSANTAQTEFDIGEGLIGQCAKDGKVIAVKQHAKDYGTIRSAYGVIEPLTVTVQAIRYEDDVIGVFELVAAKAFLEREQKLIDQMSEVFGVQLNTLQGRLRIEELLRIHQSLTDELQSQSEELLTQQDELKASNEKLEEQTKALLSSETLLQRQQEELEQANESLMRKTAELEEQVRETEDANRQIEHAKESLERQTLELSLASRYKSEFLANMSHELRTPLNSLLILSQLLKENKDGNLSEKQVEYAETICSSGYDLLKLIDDVLDLAKVESGRLDLHPEKITLSDIAASVRKTFEPIARDKGLDFEVQLAEDVPYALETDYSRVLQILKNLLSNAFKFTDAGKVQLLIRRDDAARPALAFDVRDTGIGIAEAKQKLIFEAFQQADGTTSRKYGGTGLGLSISRQLAALLGGSIELQSEEGRGSRFTLFLPLRGTAAASGVRESAAASGGMAAPASSPLKGSLLPEHYGSPSAAVVAPPIPYADDRDLIAEGDRVLLIIEDDAHFAAILLDMARSKGFKAVVALQGDTGLQLAKQLVPDAILLDIQLPVIDGWAVLVQLKGDAATRHIPVHVISVVDEIHQGLSMGAIAWLRKPSGKEQLEQAFTHIESFLDRDLRRLLIVQPDDEQRAHIINLIAHDDVSITAVAGGSEALEALAQQPFDCMVLDYGLSDVPIYDLLDKIKADDKLRRLPIIIYTGKALEKKEQLRLKKYAESIIIKDVKSPERLLDETALFLHRVEEKLPPEKQRVLQKLHSNEAVFSGKKVLLVDDDIRNVFALSNLLEGLDMDVAFAENGRQAVELLERELDFDLVLMDIMMPEMDGYEAMRAIRLDERFDRLPIIALTAKAMKEDRDKCIQAGASDYITKPVHTDQLLSLMRVWLCK